jgi:hypothetical protein
VLTVSEVPAPGPVTRWWWVNLPAKLARHGRGAVTLAADGHYLNALGPAAGLLPLLALVVGVGAGARGWWFDIAVTENRTLIIGLLVLGVVSTSMSIHWLAGFVVGDFFVCHTQWWRSPPEAWLEDFIPGFFEFPPVASFVYDRVPLIIQYLLLALLMVGVPFAARMIVASFASRIVGSPGPRLFILAALTAVAVFVFARFWSVAAPHVVRPLFTWEPVWEGDTQPPAGAVVPIQDNATIGRAAAAAMLARFAFVEFASRRRWMRLRMAAIEIALDTRLADRDDQPPNAGRLSWPRSTRRALLAGLVSTLLVAGLVESLFTGLIVFAVFAGARLLRHETVPLPTRGWRQAMDQIPTALRFAAGMLVVHGLASAMVAPTFQQGEATFETLIWPMLAGIVIMAIIVPLPTRDPPPAGQR